MGSMTVGTAATKAHSRAAVSVPPGAPTRGLWLSPAHTLQREASPVTLAASGAVLRGPGGMPSWLSGGGFWAQLPSLAWLAQGPGRVRRTAMLTMVAAPRSARRCGGQCSVPATQATGSSRTDARARVSWGLGGSGARQLCFRWVRHLMGVTSYHDHNSPGGRDCYPSHFKGGGTEAQRGELAELGFQPSSE